MCFGRVTFIENVFCLALWYARRNFLLIPVFSYSCLLLGQPTHGPWLNKAALMCNKLATPPFLSVPSLIPTTFHSKLPSLTQMPPPNSLTRAESLHCVRLSRCRYAWLGGSGSGIVLWRVVSVWRSGVRSVGCMLAQCWWTSLVAELRRSSCAELTRVPNIAWTQHGEIFLRVRIVVYHSH